MLYVFSCWYISQIINYKIHIPTIVCFVKENGDWGQVTATLIYQMLSII